MTAQANHNLVINNTWLLKAGEALLSVAEQLHLLNLGAQRVTDDHVIALARGLSILIPDLLGVEGDKIVVNASPNYVAEAIRKQLEALHTRPAGSVLSA